MIILTGNRLAQFGIVTRASKGVELTHDEVDNNTVVALDALMFQEVSWDSVKEYPAIVNAKVAPALGNTITLTPIDGYCAIKLRGSATIGYAQWVNADGWVYKTDFSKVDTANIGELGYSIPIQNTDEYLVIASSIPVDVTFTDAITPPNPTPNPTGV